MRSVTNHLPLTGREEVEFFHWPLSLETLGRDYMILAGDDNSVRGPFAVSRETGILLHSQK